MLAIPLSLIPVCEASNAPEQQRDRERYTNTVNQCDSSFVYEPRCWAELNCKQINLKLWMALLIQTSVSCGSHNLLQCSLLAFPWPKLFKISEVLSTPVVETAQQQLHFFKGLRRNQSVLVNFYRSTVVLHMPLLCCMPAVQWLKRKDCRGWWGQLVSGWDYKPLMSPLTDLVNWKGRNLRRFLICGSLITDFNRSQVVQSGARPVDGLWVGRIAIVCQWTVYVFNSLSLGKVEVLYNPLGGAWSLSTPLSASSAAV